MYQVTTDDCSFESIVIGGKKNCRSHNCRGCVSPTTSRANLVVDPVACADRDVTKLKLYLQAINEAATPRQAKLMAKALGISYPQVLPLLFRLSSREFDRTLVVAIYDTAAADVVQVFFRVLWCLHTTFARQRLFVAQKVPIITNRVYLLQA